MNETKTAIDRDATRMRVANNLNAELKRQRWSIRKASTALGVTLSYLTRRTSGDTELSASDLELFSEFLEIPIERFFLNDEKAPAAARGRAGASGISGIVDISGRVGPAGLEPTTSTVEERKFGADWSAPVTHLFAS